MNPFKSLSTLLVMCTATLGGVYGLVATLSLNGASISLWEIAIPVTGGVALGATAGSAISRWISILKVLRENRTRPSDPTLYYRGLRVPSPAENSENEAQVPDIESTDEDQWADPETRLTVRVQNKVGANRPGRPSAQDPSVDLWVWEEFTFDEMTPSASQRYTSINRLKHSINELTRDSVLQ